MLYLLEEIVFLFIKNYDHVTRLYTRILITFSRECYLLTILHTFVNMHLNDLPLRDSLKKQVP